MPLGYQGWTIPKANLGAMIQATNSLVDEFVYSRPAFGQIEEDNLSAYAMFSYEGENYRGNFGVRYVSTEVTSSGHIIDNSPADRLGVNAAWSTDIHSEKGDYSEFLPSLNFVYNVSEDIIVRFALGQAITRPNYDTLFLSAISGYPDDRKGNEQITYGNPALKPMKSTQADVSVEYYYGDGNLVSATLFTKDISDFIVGTTQANQQIGAINNDLADAENGVVASDNWTVNNFVNAGGGDIFGIEFQVNHAFDNGFGVNANYTYTDADAPAEVYTDVLSRFTESSEHSANLVAYWENDDYSARAAYNWRSEYMIREYGLYYGNRMHDDYGTLDVTLGWNINDNLVARLEVVNLTEEDDIQYGAAAAGTQVKPSLQEGHTTWHFRGETTYKLGLNFQF
jgi:iron complex outermembrane receptor protein